MKKVIVVLVMSMLIAACGTSDKKTQLEKLKKDRDVITEKIKKLEDEIAAEGGNNSNVNIAQIAVQEMKPDTFRHYIEVQGKVDGEENVTVSSQTAGIITKIYVEEGDAVKKGQVLAQLDDQVMRQTLEEVNTQLNFATNLYNKQKALWDQKIGSEVQYLTAKNNKESLENRRQTLTDQIAMSKVVSPISGTVEEIPIKIGQSLVPGLAAFRVVNFSRIKVLADVSEVYSSKIKVGNDVLVSFPDFDKEIASKINFTSKYISPINRTFQVEVRLAPQGIEFRANMIAIIKVKDYESKNTFVLPINLVTTENNQKYVYIAKPENGKMVAKKVLIKLGQSYNGNVEITEGLKTGDKVITKGYQDLEDGKLVSVI
jgi:RND family efflux transporter MFP subunit